MMTLGPVDYRKFGSVYSLAAFDLTTKLRINYGRERIIPKQKKQGVKIHRSVKVRMEADPTMVEGSEGKKYIPRAKWNVEPTWVDWLCSSKISDTMFSYSVMIRITNSKTFNPFFRLLKTLEHFRDLCPVGPPCRVFRLAFLFYWLQCRSRVLFYRYFCCTTTFSVFGETAPVMLIRRRTCDHMGMHDLPGLPANFASGFNL